MKKLAIIITILALYASGFAQSSKINNAFQDYRKGKIAKALEAIEEAAIHPDTKDQARTWFYRGNIYYKIAVSLDSTINTLRANAIDTAYASYQKSISMDAGISNDMLDISTPFIGIQNCAYSYYSRGFGFIKAGKFAESYSDFEKAIRIKMSSKEFDPSPDKTKEFLESCQYLAAISALNKEKIKEKKDRNYKDAKKYLTSLVNAKSKDPDIYIHLSDIYKEENDTVKAINIINLGEKEFADTSRIMIQKFNIYLWAGKTQIALDLLQKIKDKEPNNPIVYFNIGTVLNEMGSFEEAVKAFEKSITLYDGISQLNDVQKSGYFDALFNFGTIYFNKFLSVKDAAEKLPVSEQEKYTQLLKEANDYLAKARPYLEKCRMMKEKDRDTLYMLKQVYTRMGEMDKAKEVDAKMKELKG